MGAPLLGLPKSIYYTYRDLLSKFPRPAPVWPRSSVGRTSEDLIRGFKSHRGQVFLIQWEPSQKLLLKGVYPGGFGVSAVLPTTGTP